jgi:hypothetical protein
MAGDIIPDGDFSRVDVPEAEKGGGGDAAPVVIQKSRSTGGIAVGRLFAVIAIEALPVRAGPGGVPDAVSGSHGLSRLRGGEESGSHQGEGDEEPNTILRHRKASYGRAFMLPQDNFERQGLVQAAEILLPFL